MKKEHLAKAKKIITDLAENDYNYQDEETEDIIATALAEAEKKGRQEVIEEIEKLGRKRQKDIADKMSKMSPNDWHSKMSPNDWHMLLKEFVYFLDEIKEMKK